MLPGGRDEIGQKGEEAKKNKNDLDTLEIEEKGRPGFEGVAEDHPEEGRDTVDGDECPTGPARERPPLSRKLQGEMQEGRQADRSEKERERGIRVPQEIVREQEREVPGKPDDRGGQNTSGRDVRLGKRWDRPSQKEKDPRQRDGQIDPEDVFDTEVGDDQRHPQDPAITRAKDVLHLRAGPKLTQYGEDVIGLA